MKRFILYAVLIILSALTACDDMFNDAFSDNKSSVKYYGYVTTTNSLYSYEVLEDGSFKQIGAPVTGLILPQRIAVHPSGDYIYVAVKNSILCYRVGDNGVLTPLSPLINTIENQNMAVHPSGKYLYAINKDDAFYTYNINQDGSLIYNSKTVDTGAAVYNRGITINPSGTTVFGSKSMDGLQYICYYEVENTGKLKYINKLVLPNPVWNVIVHPSGNYLYCGTSSTIVSMNILPDGSLTLINTLSFGTCSIDIILHPSNKYLYGTSNVTSFSNFGILNNGDLMSISQNLTVPDSDQNFMAIHPNGKYVYITDRDVAHSLLICYTADAAGSLAYNTMTAKTAELPIDIKIVSKTVFGEN